ncbi:MAG: hypothetical protein FJW88_14730 [Actinobacteria bacterium]|nr:hypothetical protein [Actinomycetota bacterium]
MHGAVRAGATPPGARPGTRPGSRFWVRAIGALARHPKLWPTALVQVGRLARPGWWRHAPFLPVPDREYLRFRLETQYGPVATPQPGDLVDYLRWCRETGR